MSPYSRSGIKGGHRDPKTDPVMVDSHFVLKGRVKSGASLEKSHCPFLHCESLSKAFVEGLDWIWLETPWDVSLAPIWFFTTWELFTPG